MLRLLLLRHGKSDWDADSPSDHDRPLTERGVKAARRIGRFLQRADRVPDLALTSSAVRARSTVELAAEAGAWGCPVEVSERLYLPSVDPVLAEIRRAGDREPILLAAGHQPTWPGLVARLTGGSRPRFPTAALACIRFPQNRWSEIREGGGELAWLVTPKLLERADL